MLPFENINAPLQYLDTLNGVEVWLKREDKIHPQISGNKWRKLKYYFQDFEKSDKTEILTFGGAFSNHLAAVAAAGKMAKVPTHALVRGEEVKSNPTLDFCRAQGMLIETISRKRYALKDTDDFKEGLEILLPQVYQIAEGGKGILGVRGCIEILDDVPSNFDYIACAGGTGTTFLGLLLSGYKSDFCLYPALKGGDFLKKDVIAMLNQFQLVYKQELGYVHSKSRLTVHNDYHFGGYAKVNDELVQFMNALYNQYQLKLDPVYTAKMLFGIFEDCKKGVFKKGTKLLAIHTGGLQGIDGMNEQLRKKSKQLIYD